MDAYRVRIVITIYEKRDSKKKFIEAKTLKTEGVATADIARRLGVRRATLIEWFKEDTYHDDRGWAKGTPRKYTGTAREQVIVLKKERIDKKKYFTGSEYVRMDYAKQYPEEDIPSLWFIEEITRQEGLQTRKPKPPKGKGVVQRQLFPIKSIVTLGKIHQSCDFIGKKLKGHPPQSQYFPPAIISGSNCTKYGVLQANLRTVSSIALPHFGLTTRFPTSCASTTR